MKFTMLLSFILGLCLTNFAIAKGNESGGGGAIVVCPVDSGRPQVQMLEMAENLVAGRIKEFPSVIQQAQTNEKILELITTNLEKHIPGFAKTFLKTYEFALNKLNRQPSPVRPGNDLGEFDQRVLDGNCRIDWVAYFNDETKKLDIDESFWSLLSPIDQAALMLHEVLYFIAREHRLEISSEWIRKSVVDLFKLDEESALKAARFSRDLIPYWSQDFRTGSSSYSSKNFEGSLQFKMLRLTSSQKGITSCSSNPSVFSEIILCKDFHLQNQQTKKVDTYTTCEIANEIHNRTKVRPGQSVEINRTIRLTAEHFRAIESLLDNDAAKEKKVDETVIREKLFIKIKISKNFDLCNLYSYKGISFFPLAELVLPFESLLKQIINQKSFYAVGDQDLLLLTSGLRRGKDIDLPKNDYFEAVTRRPDITGEFIIEYISDEFK